jgi:DMSO reductase anchor subunit
MRPPISMVLFTTLAGAGQGVLLVLFGVELALHWGLAVAVAPGLFMAGAALVLALCGAGLVAAAFHLGHPLRGWRAAARWRTSWLSREVILLPVFMGVVSLWGLAHWLAWPSLALGAAASVLALALYLCTGMIYAAVKTIREWATPLTPLNFSVLGLASGAASGAALAAAMAPALVPALAWLALAATAAGVITRGGQLWRNATLKGPTTLQTAIGVRHPRIVRSTQGLMSRTFNDREFSHGRTPSFVLTVRWTGVLLGFFVPIAVLSATQGNIGAAGLAAIGLVQLAGLLAERWIFFADARHPQNLYAAGGPGKGS